MFDFVTLAKAGVPFVAFFSIPAFTGMTTLH